MKKKITILCIVLMLLPIISVSTLQTSTAQEMLTLPSSFSWQDINGTDYTTPIKD
ncbi:MAG TPA: hypothetical protein VMY59_02645 [Candidatus Thermoplasmatota archaeon]|nr:hypothetical protein [Candidatus Thermoplasmatota archaeon]